MELKTKLFKVRIEFKNAMTAFVATVLLGWLSKAHYLVYLCTVISHQELKVSNRLEYFLPLVSLTYEGMFLTIGWR